MNIYIGFYATLYTTRPKTYKLQQNNFIVISLGYECDKSAEELKLSSNL